MLFGKIAALTAVLTLTGTSLASAQTPTKRMAHKTANSHAQTAIPALHRTGPPTASASITVKEEKPGLLGEARVHPAVAQRTALAQISGAHLTSGRIEQRNGKLIYVFTLHTGAGKKPGRLHRVVVDAMSGAVMPLSHSRKRSGGTASKKNG